MNLRTSIRERLNLLGKNARSIYDMPRAHDNFLVAQVIAHMCPDHFPFFAHKRSNPRVISDRCSVLRCGTKNGHGKASIVGLPGVVDEAFFQVFANKTRSKLHHLFATQVAMSLVVAPPSKAIVKPESNIQNKTKPDTPRCSKGHADWMAITLIDWQYKTNRLHEKWGVLQQESTLNQGFTHQGEVKIRHVTYAPVD